MENYNYSFIPKLIFSFIFDKRKLELAKYNKKLQNAIDINIMHYKIFSKRYIIYEEKGKGKEYEFETDNLIYEGEYLNGKRNGKGKEYNKYGEKILEVEYINGKKKGNLSHYHGTLDFEVNNLEFLSGLSGKEYKFNKNLLNKMKNGEGKVNIYDSNLPFGGLIMTGEVLNYELNGEFILYYDGYKPKFRGNYLNGKILNGTGYDKDRNIIYELENGGRDVIEYHKNGKLKIEIHNINGKLKGEGKEYDNNGNKIFEGEYSFGKRNGKGKEYDNNGNIIFEGEYINDKKNGKGKEYYDNHELRFEGEYFNDYRFKGKEYTEGKLEYKGEYFFYKKWNGFGYNKNRDIIYQLIKGNGKIKEYSKNGILIFEGEYIDGKASKICKEYNEEGKIIYEGEYLKGKKTGKGKKYNKNGDLIYEGEFLDGILNGYGKKYSFGKLEYEGEYKDGRRDGKGKITIIRILL